MSRQTSRAVAAVDRPAESRVGGTAHRYDPNRRDQKGQPVQGSGIQARCSVAAPGAFSFEKERHAQWIVHVLVRCDEPFALVNFPVPFALYPLVFPRRNELQAKRTFQVRHFDEFKETERLRWLWCWLNGARRGFQGSGSLIALANAMLTRVIAPFTCSHLNPFENVGVKGGSA